MPSSKDPEVNRRKAREWRLANPDRHREANREWETMKRATDPAWREKKKKQTRANAAKRRAAKPELVAGYQKEWFAKHPDYNRAKLAESYKNRPALHMLWRAKSRAAKLGVPFSITADDVVIPELCPVLGVPMELGGKTVRKTSPSLDRVIPSLGYVPGNVKVISNYANIIKQGHSLEDLRQRAQALRGQLAGVEAVIAYLERETG